jgi:two-component system, NtrC family, nitrogen regulation response regulator NtrX
MAHDILIVDDETDIRMLISGTLADEGYETREAAESISALSAIRERQPSLVLLDIWLQGSELDGMELLPLLRRDHPDLPVVMISGHGNVETAVSAIKKGAYDFIEKPFKSDRLLTVVDRAIDAARLRRENAELRLRSGSESEMIGESNPMHQLRQAVERVAPTGSRVLITGPAGSGKEVAARMLHRLSRRAEGPFVVVNCAALEPDRLEIEMFGTEMRDDSGSPLVRIGLFERAHGGTLLLDEVADMPLETQGKIVRALQEQVFMRVNGSQPVKVDVRVLASTSRDLDNAMADGEFRQDLYFRLNVVPLNVPPLAARRDDIPLLASYLMQQAARLAGLPCRRLSEEATAALQTAEWPGNVRQLRNLVDWLLIMAPGSPDEAITASMLPPDAGRLPTHGTGFTDVALMALPLRQAREAFERSYLDAQVARFGGNISKTATFIGMERSALHRKLRSLGIASSERQEKADDR